MTEYRYVLMDVRVTKPKVNQHDQAAASLLAVELKKVREREKKLETALYEVFPLDLYKQARPDVNEAYHGERSQIIEHYIRAGINEIDIKEESNMIRLELHRLQTLENSDHKRAILVIRPRVVAMFYSLWILLDFKKSLVCIQEV